MGGFELDLDAERNLTGRGIRTIRVCRDCTACTPQLSSYGRDGPAFAHMLACIGEMEHD